MNEQLERQFERFSAQRLNSAFYPRALCLFVLRYPNYANLVTEYLTTLKASTLNLSEVNEELDEVYSLCNILNHCLTINHATPALLAKLEFLNLSAYRPAQFRLPSILGLCFTSIPDNVFNPQCTAPTQHQYTQTTDILHLLQSSNKLYTTLAPQQNAPILNTEILQDSHFTGFLNLLHRLEYLEAKATINQHAQRMQIKLLLESIHYLVVTLDDAEIHGRFIYYARQYNEDATYLPDTLKKSCWLAITNGCINTSRTTFQLIQQHHPAILSRGILPWHDIANTLLNQNRWDILAFLLKEIIPQIDSPSSFYLSLLLPLTIKHPAKFTQIAILLGLDQLDDILSLVCQRDLATILASNGKITQYQILRANGLSNRTVDIALWQSYFGG